MALPSSYTLAHNQLSEFFKKLRDAQAPEKFTLQLIKDFGYKSNNHRAFLPILKAIGFLSADGSPTPRYHNYRNHSESKKVMGEALKEAYSDLFLIKEKPSASDKALIQGKFKSYHNVSDNVAGLMTKTFYALLDLADLSGAATPNITASLESGTSGNLPNGNGGASDSNNPLAKGDIGLHYNIQIHLPATKDLEVYNAIFKSLKSHLLE